MENCMSTHICFLPTGGSNLVTLTHFWTLWSVISKWNWQKHCCLKWEFEISYYDIIAVNLTYKLSVYPLLLHVGAYKVPYWYNFLLLMSLSFQGNWQKLLSWTEVWNLLFLSVQLQRSQWVGATSAYIHPLNGPQTWKIACPPNFASPIWCRQCYCIENLLDFFLWSFVS